MPRDALLSLVNDRLLFVTGKGGTGKTTAAVAIARMLAARGKKTLLCEVDAQRPALEAIFGINPGYEPVRVLPGLDVCNLIWPDVLGAWLRRMVRIGWVVDAILANDMIRRFLDFVPGAQDLVEVSAIDDWCSKYDAVVVDMPASGHAFSLLDVTRSALKLFRGGPVRQRATELRARIEDPATTMVLVALPEEMVVNETLETLQRMRADTRERGLNALRQLIDEIDAGRFPGLYLVITGTPAFFDGAQGVQRLAPLAQRLHVDFGTDRRFDNPRAVQIRLAPFDQGSLVAVGKRVRDIYADSLSSESRLRALVDDAYIETLARAVAGGLGGKVGVAPRLFLKKLVADVLDRVDLHADFDPRQHYKLTLAENEMTTNERAAAGALSVDDIEL